MSGCDGNNQVTSILNMLYSQLVIEQEMSKKFEEYRTHDEVCVFV